MKKTIIIIIVVAISIALYINWSFKYVQFYPVNFNSEEYFIIERTPSPEFYSNLKKVLNYYGEDFKEREQTIYIRNKLFRDKELMYNYTKKANDSVWLFSRK